MTEGSRETKWNQAALLAGLALLALWTVACLWYPLTDTDIWWHLAAGRWMVETGAVPRFDPFATSSLGKPWIDLHWGFQLLSLALWKIGGTVALVGAKVALLFAALWLALRPFLRPGNAALLLPLAAFGLYQVRFFLDMRPLAVTLFGLAALHAVTMAHLEGRLRRPILLLFPIQVVLANMQGLYPLGAFLVTCFLAGAWWDHRRQSAKLSQPGSLKPLGIASASLWLAGFATPFGWDGFLLPLTLLARITPLPGNVFSAEIAENQPLLSLALQEPRALVPWAAMLLVVLWTCLRAGHRLASGHVLLLIGFGALGFMAQRNLPLLLLAILFAAGRHLQGTSLVGFGPPSGISGRLVFHPWAAPLWILLIVLAGAPRIRQAWAFELPGSLETPFRFPRGGADFLAANPVPGFLFNELRFGGYLAWRLHPGMKPFVDGRMILHDADFYREFLDVVDHPRGFPAYAEKWKLTHALLPIGEDRRFLPLAAFLLGREGWELRYCDGAAALLVRPVSAPESASLDEDRRDIDAYRGEADRRFMANPRLAEIARRNIVDLFRAADLAFVEWPR